MISLTVRLQVRPGHREPFLAAITDNADRTFTEPGCLAFDVSQALDDDHAFVFYELYADEAAVNAHRESPHFADWRRAADKHVVPGSQINLLASRLLSLPDERARDADVIVTEATR